MAEGGRGLPPAVTIKPAARGSKKWIGFAPRRKGPITVGAEKFR